MTDVPSAESVAPRSQQPKWRVPDTYLLLAGVGLLVFILSWLLVPGYFEVRDLELPDGSTRQLVDPESYRQAPGALGAPLFSVDAGTPGLFNAVYEGLVSGSRMGGAVGGR